VRRSHDRVDTKAEDGEARIGGTATSVAGFARGRRRRQLEKGVEKQSNPEVVHRASEEHRRELSLVRLRAAESLAPDVEQLDLLAQVQQLALGQPGAQLRRVERRRALHCSRLSVRALGGNGVNKAAAPF